MQRFLWFRRKTNARNFISTREFASLLVNRKNEILSAFVDAVIERIPAARNETRKFIEDHLASVIGERYTATAKLRERGFQKPIIALTAHAMTDVRKKALNVGFTDHLPKPIDSRELVATIAKYYRDNKPTSF